MILLIRNDNGHVAARCKSFVLAYRKYQKLSKLFACHIETRWRV